jgi:hypothetical protein
MGAATMMVLATTFNDRNLFGHLLVCQYKASSQQGATY